MIRKSLPTLFAVYTNKPYASNATSADTTVVELLPALTGAVSGNQTGSPLAGAAICAGAGYAVGHRQNNQPAPEQ